MEDIQDIAKKLISGNKGILAADESHETIAKRFSKVGIENTEDTRRRYREILFTTENIEEFISGVILFEETLFQSAGDGRSFVDILKNRGITPGIKVDKGKVPLANFDKEQITVGIDDLRERLENYKLRGAQFTKWRAVIKIGDGLPTKGAIHANAHLLARYAAIVQEAEMVPIVEPEVLMDGQHSLDECAIVTSMVLDEVFEEMFINKVKLNAILLKPNMVISGSESKKQATSEEIAEATIEIFKKTVPSEVPGIVFLSGGQSAKEATKNLCEINRENDNSHPWALSFSFGRALQDEALKAWSGNDENWQAAQKAFYEAARMDAEARRGIC